MTEFEKCRSCLIFFSTMAEKFMTTYGDKTILLIEKAEEEYRTIILQMMSKFHGNGHNPSFAMDDAFKLRELYQRLSALAKGK